MIERAMIERDARWYREITRGIATPHGQFWPTPEDLAGWDKVSSRTVYRSIAKTKRIIAEKRAEKKLRPMIVLEGCRPMVPYHGRSIEEFHAPSNPVQIGGSEWPICPACKGRISATPGDRDGDGRIVRVCLWCHGMGATHDRLADLARESHQDRLAAENANPPAAVMVNVVKSMAKAESAILEEPERRKIWNGNRRGCLRLETPESELTGRDKQARDFLRDIGQEPDYDLALGRGGKILGRFTEGWVANRGWSNRRDWSPPIAQPATPADDVDRSVAA